MVHFWTFSKVVRELGVLLLFSIRSEMKTFLAFYNIIEPERATMPPVLNAESLESENNFLSIPDVGDAVNFEGRNGVERRRVANRTFTYRDGACLVDCETTKIVQ